MLAMSVPTAVIVGPALRLRKELDMAPSGAMSSSFFGDLSLSTTLFQLSLTSRQILLVVRRVLI
jgi:hypothetical protein